MTHIMDSEKEEIKKYLKTSSIKAESSTDKEKPELMTNIEAFHEGKFPENLAEKFENPPNLKTESLLNNIEVEHKRLLKLRPTPELLESANLIGKLEDLRPPEMGELYEEKRLTDIDEKKKLADKE